VRPAVKYQSLRGWFLESEYSANFGGQFAPPEAVAARRKGAAAETATGFKNGNQVGGSHSPQGALGTGKPTGYEKSIEHTRRQARQQAGVPEHQAGSFCGQLPVKCAVFQFPGGPSTANERRLSIVAGPVTNYPVLVQFEAMAGSHANRRGERTRYLREHHLHGTRGYT